MAEEEKDESLITHLEALRKTILKCLYSVAIVLPFAFYFSPKILNLFIKLLLRGNNITLNFFSPAEVFIIQIKLGVLISIIVCFPYIIKQLWDFILPALYDNERKFLKSLVIISSLLFCLGVIFCVFIILPLIINFGLSFQAENIQAVFRISEVINLALWLSLAFGLMFQLPVITFYLIKSGLVEYNSIANKRPYVVVGLLIIAGILTPPDIVSQVMLALPSYLLFEGGLLFAKLNGKKDLAD